MEIKKDTQEKQQKLHGYEFWNSIGAPKYVCAPMVAQSELPFRLLTKKYGCQLTYSPMINSENYVKSKPKPTQREKYAKYRDSYFRTCPEDRPLFAQFCGNNPEYILKAARDFEKDVDAIDINFGCPQNIAKKGNYGSYLLEQPDIVVNVISELAKNLNIPVTAKMRMIHENEEATIELAKKIEQAGASVITVHGRSRDEKLGLCKECNWDLIKKIKESVKIPVIANGGIYNFQDVQNCLEYTKVDAVMSCEGLLEYPALFSGKNDIDVDYIAQEYMQICKQNPPSKTYYIKGHLCKLFFTSKNSELELFKELNDKCHTIEQYQAICEKLCEARKHIPSEEKRGYYFRWWNNAHLLQLKANKYNSGSAKIIEENGEIREKKQQNQNQQKQQQQDQTLKRDRTLSQEKNGEQDEEKVDKQQKKEQ